MEHLLYEIMKMFLEAIGALAILFVIVIAVFAHHFKNFEDF